MISPTGLRRGVALCAVLGAGLALSTGPALAASPTPPPTSGQYKVDTTVPAATGAVTATMHEFRLVSDGSLITSTPTLLPGQRVSLLWRGLPDGDWLGTLTATGGATTELGLVAAAESQLLHELTVPTGLAAGTYTVTFRLGVRLLNPSFVFVVAAPKAVKDSTTTSGGGTTTTTTTNTTSGTKTTTGKSAAASPVETGSGAATSAPEPGAQPDDDEPILSVSGLRSTYDPQLNPFDGALDITATVTNNGNVALAGTLDVVVRGMVSVVGESVPQTLAPLDPGESRELEVRVRDVEQAGLLRIELRLAPHPAAAGADASGALSTGDALIAPASADRASAALPTVYRESSAWAIPWSALAVLALLAAAAWLALRNIALPGPRVAAPVRWPGDPTGGGRTRSSHGPAAAEPEIAR